MTSSSRPAHLRLVLPISLVCVFLVADVLRVGAAIWLVRRNQTNGVEHEFADSELYWKLALRVAARESYDDGKRQVLRTPGYPVFLAGCIRLFGPSTTAARHAQAAVGAASCVLLFFLVRKLVGPREAWVAAALGAVYPFAVFLSAVILSEAVFTFVLLAQLLCLVHLIASIEEDAPGRRVAILAALTGLTGAVATLVRPSWYLAVPVIVLALAFRRGPRSRRFFAAAGTLMCAFLLAMAPWLIRNVIVTGRVVVTTLWVGASLYDGLNEHATGASNMKFMDRPETFGLDPGLDSMSELEQDSYLRREAWRFARSHPWRVVELAAIKFGRYWNPLPNADEWRSGWLGLVSVATCGPVLVLALVSAWRLRRRWRVLVLLAGPVFYFCAIHLVFVSSIRYREAAMLPVLGLVAAALTPRSTASSQS